MGRNSNADESEIAEVDKELPVKTRMANTLKTKHRIAKFKGSIIIEQDGRWQDLSSDRFAAAVYATFGSGVGKSRVTDLEHYFRASAPDLSHLAHLIAFADAVWDMKKLEFVDTPVEDCVYRVPFHVKSNKLPIQFVLDLAKGDKGIYDDIMQSVAPLIMDKKPTGVIWYLGSGANGKSTLVHLLYKIFGSYLTEITVKQLEDERDTPQLNGKLGNVCKESSEGFIEDTRTYKSIGTHESFSVHKFHSQDMVEIEGNIHHIFSANNIPTFGDKSYGARRRTLVVPFNNQFKPDEMFEDKTFTKAFTESFLGEMVAYAIRLKEQGYEFKFSDTTQIVKEKYDTDANTAQTYIDELYEQKVWAFMNYRLLFTDYENWCLEHGYRPSGITILRRVVDEKGYVRRSIRGDDERVSKFYVTGSGKPKHLTKVAERLGLFQLDGTDEDASGLSYQEQQKLLDGF